MGDPLWEDYVQRATDLLDSRLWSRERAMAAYWDEFPPLDTATKADPHPADWPPEERPGFDDIEAARLLGVEPRPPARPDDPVLRPEQVQTMTQLAAQMKRISQIMEANGAPQPKTFMIHPKTWDELKAELES